MSERTVQLLLAVGAGVTDGEFTNRAWVLSEQLNDLRHLQSRPRPSCASFPIRTFDCTDVIGKVFDDANRNGVQGRRRARPAGVRAS